MKNSLVLFLKSILIGVIVLRLIFVIDFGHRDSFSVCWMELIDCEEESESEHIAGGEGFFEQSAPMGLDSVLERDSNFSFSFVSCFSTYIIEIVSPPPQG